ncbi:PGG domain-containing protein [Artemisia annua]|uniref:PGG domain-containing protein n=1 Tax=Artemisia annua TaxID=35608 RepID=A0A2U1NT21_ARTAN|nr:PGG domain-containing protein [Artemisia annua]
MEMEQLSPNHKRSLSGSETARPSMEMGDSSQIKSHSQEINSQTGSDLHMDRFLKDDVENNKDLLESSYLIVPGSPPISENKFQGKAPSYTSKVIHPGDHSQAPSYTRVYLCNESYTGDYEPQPVSPPLRRRHQANAFSDYGGNHSMVWSDAGLGFDNNSKPPSMTDFKPGFYNNSKPPSYGDLRMDDFENDHNSNPSVLASQEPPLPKSEPKKTPNEDKSTKKNDNLAISAQPEDVNYTRASTVSISNFVSVKLSGKSNYDMWKAQMECLMKSHKMRGLVIKDRELPVNKNNELIERYEILLNGWLIGSLSEEIIKDNRIYGKGAKASTLLEPRDKKEKQGTSIELKLIKKLRNATLEGYWWKAKSILKTNEDLAREVMKINPHLAKRPSTLKVLTRNFPSQISFTETLMYPSLNDVCHKLVKRSFLLLHSLEYLYARAGETLWKMRRFKNKYYYSLFPVLVISLHVVPIKNIEKERKEHKEAKKFLKWICNQNILKAKNSKDSPFDKFYKESLMEAACRDVYEVLDQILKLSSNAMKVKNKDGHNIIQLAVINRSTKVYNLLTPIIEGKGSYRRVMDVFNNNLLHLAGRLAPLAVLSCTSGAALQLQQDLQWREEVKKLMEPTQHTQKNVDYETPEMVFSREHANLVKEGEKWMKTTAESCSITAALIITIVFAAAITVPGGSNQETGFPLFKKRIAFNIFAVADAVSLFSASTSLLVFLSILTTRFAEKDFLISLPRRLFVGLCLLFLSTTAMMFAFSTILFIVFCDERLWMLAPIGGLTCFPIAAIVTLQLPLVIDLYQATSITIFVKRKESYRVKRDSSYNNLLHLAGKLEPSSVLSRKTGAPLQLQRELQFREEVGKIMEPAQLTEVNADNETPEMGFTRDT